MPKTLVIALLATGCELCAFEEGFDKLLQWDCIVYALFTVPLLSLTAFLFAKETDPKFCKTTKLLRYHALLTPTPVWLILKPPNFK